MNFIFTELDAIFCFENQLKVIENNYKFIFHNKYKVTANQDSNVYSLQLAVEDIHELEKIELQPLYENFFISIRQRNDGNLLFSFKKCSDFTFQEPYGFSDLKNSLITLGYKIIFWC